MVGSELDGREEAVRTALSGDACSKEVLLEAKERGGKLSMPVATEVFDEKWSWAQLSYRFDKLACRKGGNLSYPLGKIERLEPENEGESSPRVLALTDFGYEVAESSIVASVREESGDEGDGASSVAELQETVTELERELEEVRADARELQGTVQELEKLLPIINERLPAELDERMALLEALEVQVSQLTEGSRPAEWKRHYEESKNEL